MADSVGKIQLDLEITPNSIAQQISAVSRAFASGMQRSFSQMKNFTRGTFSDMARQMRSVVSRETPVPDDTTMKIESLVEQMENASNQADHFRQKLKDLQNSYDQLTDRAKQGTFGQKLREEILRTEERMLRYGEKSDKLRMEIEKLEQSTRQLERSTGRTGRATERASRGFTRVGESARRAQGPVTGFANTLHRALMRVLRQVFIFAVLYKAIRGMIEYTGAALKTNQAFMRSLNQVKTNLQVAFMPIYQAILPALNTLMAWLARATAYIASFVSALFGKTYKQSFAAAKGLNKMKKSLDGTAKAAKKSLSVLAGFDEINLLADPNAGADTGGPDLVAPPVDMTPVDEEMQGLAGRIKAILAALFQPVKAAWENEGAATIAAARYALEGIWALVKEIGKSFAIVWTGGTGQAILETFLRILQQILGLIGDIGFTFANAWAEGGRGTAIIQGIANVFLHLLELVEHIGESLRNVWGEIGPTVAAVFLDIINATVDVLENLAEKLLYVWDHGGQHLFEGLIRLGAKIFELAGYIYTNFVVPFVNWFIDMIAPAIAEVLDWAGWLLDKFVELIDWLMGDGKPVLDTIVTILGSMAMAFGIVKLAIALYTGVMTVATAVTSAFGAVMAFITSPIGIVTVVLGTLIATGILLYKNWDKICAWLKSLWEGIKDVAVSVFNKIKDGITNAFNTVKTTITNIWNSIKNTLSGVWNGLKTTATTIFNGVKNTITGAFNTVKTTVLNVWNTIKTTLSGVWNGIKNTATNIFNSIRDSIVNTFNSVKSKISSIWNSIKDTIKGAINGIIKFLNKFINAFNKINIRVPKVDIPLVGNVGGFEIGLPKIPTIPLLARGGIVDQPTLAMIGEKRKKEAVLPLEQNTGWMDTLAAKLVAAMQTQLTAVNTAGGGGDIYVYIGNEQVDAYIHRSQDRRNIRSNGR